MLGLIGVGGVIVPNQVSTVQERPILILPVPPKHVARQEHTLMIEQQVMITVITPDDLIASVTALTVGLRAQAQVIGLAIFFNRFIHEVTKNAYTTIVPAALTIGVYDVDKIEAMVRGLSAMTVKEYSQILPELAGPENLKLMVGATKVCFIGAFKLVYLITIAFGVTACVASMFIGNVGRYMDDHVAVVL